MRPSADATGRSGRPVRRIAAMITVLIGLALPACSQPPRLDELGARFAQDGLALAHFLADGFTQSDRGVEIVADGTRNIPCDDGARRSFEATFAMRDGDPDDNLDLFTTTIWAAFAVPAVDEGEPAFHTEDRHYYSLHERGYPNDLGYERIHIASNDDETITFEIRAAGHPGSTVLISGETACIAT